MSSVTDTIKVLSVETDVPEPYIIQIARNLLNNGVLPKSVGSRIAQVEPEHVAMLLLAIFVATKFADGSARAQQYAALKWGGESGNMTFGTFLARALTDLHTSRNRHIRINRDITVPYSDLRIEIVTTYPAVGISAAPHFGVPAFEGSINFADTPMLANYWPSTKPRTAVTIPGDTLHAIVNRLFGFVDHSLDQDSDA
jgi:hypothetical protein